MLRSFQLLAFLAGASALLVSPLAAPHASQRIAASPQMACNGGKGGSGGEGPPLDKMRRGRLGALIQSADDAEKVKAILISSQTERLLLNMNWKVRSSMQRQLRKRAAQFGVEVPMDFAAYNVRPRNTPKKASLLVMSALRPSGGPGCTGCPAQSQGLWNPSPALMLALALVAPSPCQSLSCHAQSLKPTITEESAPHPDAVAALAKLRFA